MSHGSWWVVSWCVIVLMSIEWRLQMNCYGPFEAFIFDWTNIMHYINRLSRLIKQSTDQSTEKLVYLWKQQYKQQKHLLATISNLYNYLQENQQSAKSKQRNMTAANIPALFSVMWHREPLTIFSSFFQLNSWQQNIPHILGNLTTFHHS